MQSGREIASHTAWWNPWDDAMPTRLMQYRGHCTLPRPEAKIYKRAFNDNITQLSETRRGT